MGAVFPFTRGLGVAEVLIVGALVGVISVARSPTAAIAIIRECRARGTFTDTVFGVTVGVDFLVILPDAVVLSLGQAAVRAGQGVDAGFVALRMVLINSSSFLGCTLAGESPRFSRLCGLTFITQAGVSIGLAQVIGSRFPGWGRPLQTFLIACIALNQILGPLTIKYALDRIRDSGREP